MRRSCGMSRITHHVSTYISCIVKKDLTETHIDDADLVEGAPCAVQVAGRNLQDEELLRDVEIIAGVLDV